MPKKFSVDVEKETTKVQHEVYSSSSSLTTLSTKTLAEDLTICEEWKLSIDLKLPNGSITEWRNIFGLYVDKSTGQLDQRLLAVSITSDQSRVTLLIVYRIHTSKIYKYKITKKVKSNNWINLKVSQMKGVYEIKVDYKLVYNKSNLQKFAPTSRTNVKLVTGKVSGKPSGEENISIIVQYRNFKINTCKTTSKKLRLCF